ncbi:hypothetical protein GWO43_22065, partial [candidate division KSB1 bacterium]|nr:hypothetical protein [candidate division KSB1 bacterium]NIR72550.1 hypothetical protein [candidate division KSB1 bacterium]NIS27302.1 hypothetical protein [candidate division KSB1 bacterium]NIT73512.1 hypothetical protein [candidate division KSB1 bacterium]NIU28032.1 hypothetical protein [candidate division KSB1 bacterium]
MKFQQDYPKWKSWNLTTLTQKWLDGTAANYGVIPKYRDNFLWATNEDTDGYDLRLRSSEDYDTSLNGWPYLEIIWSENLRTVYFLKDHLGGIRATVDTAADTVVDYDDYDAWGLILGGRSLATPWSSVQGTARTSFPGEIKAVK